MALLRARNTATASATNAITVTTPTCVAGDMLFFVIAGDGANAFPQTAPTGWVAADNSSLGDHSDVYVYHRVATGTEAASYTFTANGPSQKLCAQMLAYIGPTAFQRASVKVNPTSTLSAPPTAHVSTATTANAAGNMLLAVLVTSSTATGSTPASSNIATSWTPDTGFIDQGTVANGTSLSLNVSDGSATSTTVSAATFTANNATDGQFIMLVYTDTSQTVRPTGFAATAQLGSFSVINGSNNSVSVVGLRGTTGLGAPKFEADYGVALDGTVQNLVLVACPAVPQAIGWPLAYPGVSTPYYGQLSPYQTYVSAGEIDPIAEGSPAYQPDAFQANTGTGLAFQLVKYTHVSGVQGSGAVGSVIYTAAYAASGVLGIGQVGTLAQYHVDYPITGVYGTGQVGAVDVPLLVYVSGIYGTGQLGTVALHFDCIFTLPKGIYYLRPMVGRVGAPNVTYDKIFAITGLAGTSALGSVDPQVLYAVTGVHGTSALGSVDPQVLYRVLGLAGSAQLGTFVAGWVQAPTVTGVQAAGQLNPPVVKNHQTFNGLSVAGTGGVGQVGFQISSTAAIEGVVGLGHLGTVAINTSGSAAPAGLQAAGGLGHVTALGMPRLDTHGDGRVGVVSFIIDCEVHPIGIHAVGELGLPGERRDTEAHVTGVQATGSIGSAATALSSARDHRNDIYVRLQ
jgi:hypothetical protein